MSKQMVLAGSANLSRIDLIRDLFLGYRAQSIGVLGHAGSRVLVEALMRNYRVRAVVCMAEQDKQIHNTKPVKSFLVDLNISVVQDSLKRRAFDNALQGVGGVLHTASPLAITLG
jgi:hypothetical protein